jgi:hypothetical protein
MTKTLNLSGKKFGKLSVIKRDKNYTYNDDKGKLRVAFSQWKCKCECGKIVTVVGRSLVAGRTKSCGCLRFETKYPEGKSFNKLFQSYKGNAKRRSIPFKLTDREFSKLVLSPCFYTGLLPTKKYNGIDRKNPKLGYTVKNCVPCCYKINRAKSDMPIKEFLSLIGLVSRHLPVKG